MKKKIFVVFAIMLGVLVGIFAGSKIQATPLRLDEGDVLSRVPTIEYAKPVREDMRPQEISSHTDQTVLDSQDTAVSQENTVETGGVPEETGQEISSETRPVRYRVMGEGRVEVNPDCAEVTVRVEYTDLVKTTAKSQAKSIYDELVLNLNQKGIENIRLASDYVYLCCGREMCFKADMYATFKTCDLNTLGTLLEGVESEYITITGVAYSVQDYESSYAQAIKDAISNATSKMQKIVDGDVKLIGVKEDFGCFPICVYKNYDNMDITNDIQNPITITANIIADFVVE